MMNGNQGVCVASSTTEESVGSLVDSLNKRLQDSESKLRSILNALKPEPPMDSGKSLAGGIHAMLHESHATAGQIEVVIRRLGELIG